MSEAARKWSGRIGLALAACSVAFVAARFLQYRDDLAAAHVPRVVWLAAPLFAALYAASSVLLASAWRDLLAAQGQPAGLRWCVGAYGLSQLAKYIPGNVFQFAGRQLIGVSGGLPHSVLARSALHELLGLTAAGGLISLWALPLVAVGLSWVSTPLVGAATVGLALATVRLVAGARIARALGAHLLFLLAAATVFFWLLGLLAPHPDQAAAWLPIWGAYTAAWMAGFATPGAPAGLGVRELVLLFLLSGRVQEETLLVAVALARLITVLGDLLFFGAAAWAARTR
ncbi:MAG: hypothetical protein J4F30_04700 [Acidobacteria bacterium]|nr:hypothetical protein [Acidobacteriota bacterium]